MTSTNTEDLRLTAQTRLPMLKVFIADPFYATNPYPSYVCAIDISAHTNKNGEVDLLNSSNGVFVNQMNIAFARALNTCLDCIVHPKTRADIVNTAFFNDGSDDYILSNNSILKAIDSVARAIIANSNLYCNKLSFEVMHDGWLGTAPFDLEFRVEWVDAT